MAAADDRNVFGEPFAERWAEVKDVRLRYYVGGEGAPLLLLHGLGGGAVNWVDLAPLLARGHRVLVPDLPGHGGSSPLPAAATLDPYVDRVARLAEREGLGDATVVGHSLGGLVALRLAVSRPEHVRALVLTASAGIRSATREAERFLNLAAFLRPSTRYARHRRAIARSRILRNLVFGYFGASDPSALPESAVHGFLAPLGRHSDTVTARRALVRDDPRLDLKRVQCPVLLIWGARDNQVTVADAFEYARRLRAPLRLIADCGHLLIGERPDVCAAAVEAFLDGVR
jgi:pimeloyl-ACP methyl ester carboxylesterase